MARARRKTTAQKVVDTAAIGLPAPVRSVVATRWGAPLAIAIVLGLLGTGVATVDWNGWVPHLKINQERAAEVRKEISDEVKLVAEKRAEKKEPEPQRQIEKLGTEVKQIGARIFKDQSR